MERNKIKKVVNLFIFKVIVFNPLFLIIAQSKENMIIKIDSIHSKYLNEYRKFFIYIPNLNDNISKYDVIYATDGQEILDGKYISKLDSLIQKKSIKPTVFIGVFSNEKKNGYNSYLRNVEYTYGNSPRYLNHKKFFAHELMQHINKNYDLSNKIGKKIFYGFSNGAAFGIDIFICDNKKFDFYMCFSPLGVNVENLEKIKNNKLSKLFIAYGNKEIFIALDEYKKLCDKLKKSNVDFDELVYTGGHDRILWKNFFFQALVNSQFTKK